MRQRVRSGDLSVQVITGSHVALLGMDVAKKAAEGLLGFAIERIDHALGRRAFLNNFLLFAANDKGGGSDHSSQSNPFQAFLWGDYAAEPGHAYTYVVTAMYGSAKRLRPGDSVRVRMDTENPELGNHAVHFNRGVGASQAYAIRFGNRSPGDVPFGEAYDWLSRGLIEALLRFIGQANDSSWGLRAAVYEFQHPRVLNALAIAGESGADVSVVFDAVRNKTGPAADNRQAIKDAGLDDHATTIPRTHAQISHNKFIVLLKNQRPVAVWTGSTNLTEGGIFGHSNVGHIVREPKVATAYLAYWKELAGDPTAAATRQWTGAATKIPARLPRRDSVTTVFSPRTDLEALDWYARLMDGAKESVFLTAAFGVSDQLRQVFETDRPYLRYLLLDTTRGEIETMRRDPDNRLSAGGYIGRGGWHQWMEEWTNNLNDHVEYIHTKYMLIDPLGNDPITITGSANFSKASTTANDENMLVIRGDSRVADLYLGEFMRLFNHYRLRGKVKAPRRRPGPAPGVDHPGGRKLYLRENDEWARPFFVQGSPPYKERLLFR
jgi:phosphatidylserine/phosphatidylglycerophosphate/cardiolipin synthase-like enzyme